MTFFKPSICTQLVDFLFIMKGFAETPTLHSPTDTPIMSPAPPGLSSDKGIEKRRRLSFFKPNLESPPSLTDSSSSPPGHRRAGQIFDVNFHITSIRGIPTSWVKQYRVVASCDNERSPTSWRASTKPELLVVETTPLLERLQKSARITLAIERRNVLGKPTTIGKSKALSVSELEEKQNTGLSKYFTLDLIPVEGSQTILLELNIRLLSSAGGPEVPDGEARARPVFEIYTTTVSDTFKVWDGLDPRLPDPSRQVTYRVLKEMMQQIHKYIHKHSRGIMSFKIEDNTWTFLRTTAKRIETYKASHKDKAPPQEDFSSLAKQTFLGFRILLHLHRPHMRNCGKLQMEYFENELQAITNPSTRTRRSQSITSTISGPEIYPELSKLKGVDMRLSCSQGSGFDLLYSNITFQSVARWMVDLEAEHQVFWLHGKLESGTARCPMAPALVEASRILGFPAAYYSFSRGATQTPGHPKTRDILSSLIYQLSLFDTSLAAAFNSTITQSSEPFESLDFYSQFQVLLHTLLKLSSTDEVKFFPVLLLIDDLEPMNGDQPSQEFSHLLQALYSASVATNDITPVSSSSSVDRRFDFPPTSSSSSSSETLRESLAFPPFLRTVVLSRSLGDKPGLIEKFAFIRDGHQLFGTHHHSLNGKANKLYNSAINGPSKGKCGREEIPMEYSPLNPIAEVNSQASFI